SKNKWIEIRVTRTGAHRSRCAPVLLQLRARARCLSLNRMRDGGGRAALGAGARVRRHREVPGSRRYVLDHITGHAWSADLHGLRQRTRTLSIADTVAGEVCERAAIRVAGGRCPR